MFYPLGKNSEKPHGVVRPGVTFLVAGLDRAEFAFNRF